MDIEVQGWPAGTQAMNPVYLDTAHLLRARFLPELVYNLFNTQLLENAS
ncbi:MAG: hypothetical protein HY525_08215 [Betaproteobacteria bacterium]|nr:hypothetical protein [Betaproteobacteria bacterium]